MCPKERLASLFSQLVILFGGKKFIRWLIDIKLNALLKSLIPGATTISVIYKDRRQIKIFFKTLKKNLKVKTFVGSGKNVLYIQIWTALILEGHVAVAVGAPAPSGRMIPF